jgi:hypothetical protein
MKGSAYTNWKAKEGEEITLYFSGPLVAATLIIKSESSIEILVYDGGRIHNVVKNTASDIVVTGYEVKLKPLKGNAEGSFTFLGGPKFERAY